MNNLTIEFFELLSSRKIFTNFITAGIMYRLGREIIPVKCRNNKAINMHRFIYGGIVRGYYQGFIKEFNCGHDSIRINNLEILPFPEYKNNYWDLGCCKFTELRGTIRQTIIKQEYSDVDVEGRVVLDIGAYIGDSAVYFMANGAKKVYAVEPHPEAFNEMLINIRLNNLQDRIIPINSAISTKVNYIYIDQIDIDQTAISNYGMTENKTLRGIKVPTVALADLVMRYNIDTDVLKMDCEGCEFDAIVNEFNVVKKFRQLIFECHGSVGSCNSLVNKLSSIYKCNTRKLSKITSIIYCS